MKISKYVFVVIYAGDDNVEVKGVKGAGHGRGEGETVEVGGNYTSSLAYIYIGFYPNTN